MTAQILVLGAGYAGVLAALRVARSREGRYAQVTLVNSSPNFVERIRLYQNAAAHVPKTHSLEKILAPAKVQLVVGYVQRIDPVTHTVSVQTAAGVQSLPYGYLVYALGSGTDLDSVPGVREHADSLSSPTSSARLFGRLSALPVGGRLLVVGGGLTGIEAVTELAEAFPKLHVTLMSRGQVDDEFSDAGGRYVREKMARLNIALRERVRVRQVNAGSALLEDGSSEPFDVCLWAGAFTVPSLAREAGLHVNDRGQVVVDAALRSVSHPDVLAAGDSAAAVDAPVNIRMGCVTAMPMGAHAGETLSALLANETPEPFNFAYPLRCVALGQKDGIVQFTDGADKIVSRVITGRLGAFVKNVILRYTFMSLVLEGKGWFRFMWQRSNTPVQSQQRVTDGI